MFVRLRGGYHGYADPFKRASRIQLWWNQEDTNLLPESFY